MSEKQISILFEIIEIKIIVGFAKVGEKSNFIISQVNMKAL